MMYHMKGKSGSTTAIVILNARYLSMERTLGINVRNNR